MNAALRPVAPNERIGALDLLRGWAMFGVLWSNLNDSYGPPDPKGGLDSVLNWTQNWLVESRFYSLLILLFGIGFGIQLMRAGERGLDITRTYYRRSAALLLIGLIHGTLIWSGDILTAYALVSFALVLFRDASARTTLIWSVMLWTVGAVVVRELMFLAGLRFMVPGGGGLAQWVYPRGTWLQIEHQRLHDFLDWWRWGPTVTVGILAAFLLGLWSVKTGFFRRLVEDPRVTRRLLLVSMTVALVGYVFDIWGSRIWPHGQTFQLAMLRVLGMRFLNSTEMGGAVTYACLLLLFWQRPLGKKVLRPLAATGRMALTTYLTQSIICTMLFYSYGLGWYGKVGYSGIFAITLILFACQMAFSTWWLTRYAFGPAEWLWRTLTYGKSPAMRRETSVIPEGAIA